MRNLIKGLIFKVALLSMAMPLMAQTTSGPLDDGIKVCGVPVCSIAETLDALGKLNEDGRYNYINKLVYTYKESTDEAILEHLVVVAKELKTLTTDLKDADWVIREASSLSNNSILNLAKYSKIEASKIIRLFKQLDNATNRYNVIAYFQGQLANIEDIESLNALVLFALAAKDYSLSMEDEDWIPRAAGSLASEITIKLVALDPMHEGVYTVEMTEGTKKALSFDKIVILDSSSSNNLVVQFLNTKLKQVVFKYTNTSISGNTISGMYVSNGSESSKFELVIDRSNGSISGFINSTRNGDMNFKGSQTFSTRSVFEGKTPIEITENDILGDMKGQILGVKGTLSITKYTPKLFSASFVADNGLIVIDFTGKLFIKNGVLLLTHKDKIKLALGLRETEEGILWTGVSFSITNGKVVNSSFIPNL